MSEGAKNHPLPESRRDFSNLRALGVAALAGLLYLLLAAAAIETFIRGSTAWWWVAIVVAAYLGGSAALWWFGHPLWHRVSWETKATISFLVLLGLLALTAWLSGGAEQGLKLVGLPTSTLLIVVTAVAVAYSGMILMRLNYPHPAIRWAIGALAAYSVIACVWAIAASTPYSDLLRGESFWSWLHRWLQGAFIGVFILVPVALLYHIVNSLQQTRSIDLRRSGLPILGLMLTLVMAVAAIRAPAAIARNQMQFDLPSGTRLGPMIFARGESGSRPVGAADRFQEGIKAVYTSFNLEGLKTDDTVSVVWYKGAEQLLERTAKVSELLGSVPNTKRDVWFPYKFESGARPGGYFVEISVNGNLALAGSFAVDPK